MKPNNDNIDDKLIKSHEYDGIQELDNPLPGWWLWTFYITIIVGCIYFYYYEYGGGPSLDEQLQTKLESIHVAKTESSAKTESKTEDQLVAMLGDSSIIEKGKAEFMTKCAACHGPMGQGLIGPNLTDKYWVHGDGSIKSINSVAVNGVIEKGMPAWKDLIKPDLLEFVSVYIKSLEGSNPPGAKAPEGNLFE